MAGDAPHRSPHRVAVVVNRDLVFVGHVQIVGRLRTHDDRVVPRQARNRTGQFLQPRVVRIAPVEDVGIAVERDFVARSR